MILERSTQIFRIFWSPNQELWIILFYLKLVNLWFFTWRFYIKKKDGEWSHSLGDLPRKNGGLIVMGDLLKWKKEEWSHSLGDLPRGMMVSLWWVTYPVENMNIFRSGEKCRDFSKWSCCDGRPAQMKNFGGGEKCENFSKWFHREWFYCNG